MLKKRFAILSVLLALLCVFTFAFAACDNGSEGSGEGGVAEPGDPFEDYVEIPAEETEGPPTIVHATVTIEGSNVLYTDGTAQEKSATLTAAVRGLGDAAYTTAWSIAAGSDKATIAENETAATVTLKDEAGVGVVTVKAVVSYFNGEENETAEATHTINVVSRAMNSIASVDFDEDSTTAQGTSVSSFESLYDGVTATYGGGSGEAQSTTVHGGSGKALRIGSGQNAGAYFTLDFSGYNGTVVSANETVSISYWSYIDGNPIVKNDQGQDASDGSDWSSIATAVDGQTVNSSLRYLTLNSREKSDCSDHDTTNYGNVWPSHADSAHAGNWAAMLVASQWIHVTVEVSATQINYYVNGTLQVSYDSTTSPAKNAIAAVITDIRGAINGTGMLKMFGNKEGKHDLYVDDVRITKNISAADLYAAANAQ